MGWVYVVGCVPATTGKQDDLLPFSKANKRTPPPPARIAPGVFVEDVGVIGSVASLELLLWRKKSWAGGRYVCHFEISVLLSHVLFLRSVVDVRCCSRIHSVS